MQTNEKRAPGRPAAFPGQKTETLAVTIPEVEANSARVLAAKRGESLGALVSKALRPLLARNDLAVS